MHAHVLRMNIAGREIGRFPNGTHESHLPDGKIPESENAKIEKPDRSEAAVEVGPMEGRRRRHATFGFPRWPLSADFVAKVFFG